MTALKLPGLPFALEPAGSPPAGGDPADLVRVGFLAQSPTGDGCAATFDRITFGPCAPKNLRDGS